MKNLKFLSLSLLLSLQFFAQSGNPIQCEPISLLDNKLSHWYKWLGYFTTV